MKDPTFQFFSLITYLLRFRPTLGDQPTPARKRNLYIHIQIIGFYHFSTCDNPYIFFL